MKKRLCIIIFLVMLLMPLYSTVHSATAGTYGPLTVGIPSGSYLSSKSRFVFGEDTYLGVGLQYINYASDAYIYITVKDSEGNTIISIIHNTGANPSGSKYFEKYSLSDKFKKPGVYTVYAGAFEYGQPVNIHPEGYTEIVETFEVVEKTEVPSGGCSTNLDCPENQFCSGSICENLSCSESQTIKNHQCVEAECEVNNQCEDLYSSDYICDIGTRTCKLGCVSSSSCPVTQQCKTGRCRDFTCGECEYKYNHQCVKDPNCVPSCSNECDYTGQSICYGSARKVCADHYDSDKCLEWGKAIECSSGMTCSNGLCKLKEGATQTQEDTVKKAGTYGPLTVGVPSGSYLSPKSRFVLGEDVYFGAGLQYTNYASDAYFYITVEDSEKNVVLNIMKNTGANPSGGKYFEKFTLSDKFKKGVYTARAGAYEYGQQIRINPEGYTEIEKTFEIAETEAVSDGTCGYDLDCVETQSCSEGICVDVVCAEGLMIQTHQCAEAECEVNNQCEDLYSSDYICESGTCKPGCMDNSTCPGDKRCEKGMCKDFTCGECEYKSNHKCVRYECCLDSECEEDLVCNKHYCVIPKEFQRDVLIVTMGKKLDKTSDYEGTIKRYQTTLKSEGLSSFYLELDSDKLKKFFGTEPVYYNDWKNIKRVIEKVAGKIKPKYILILGGVDVILMPPANTEAKIPTIPVSDDRYADINNDGIPDLAIGRIPTPSGESSTDIIVTALESAIKVRNKNKFSKVIIADICLFLPSCTGIRDIDMLSNVMFDKPCKMNDKCLPAPPYCSSARGSEKCSKKTELFYELLHNDIINLNAHANPYSFSAETTSGPYDILTSQDLSALSGNPLFFTIGCHAGKIDCSNEICVTKEGNVFSFLSNGAVAYVGNTRYGYGGDTAELLSKFYKNLRGGMPVGKALLEMKRDALSQSSSDSENAVIYEIQLYGDPTLKIKW